MGAAQLFQQIKKKQSFLCVGLDADLAKIPAHLSRMEFPLFEFNRRIIDATSDMAVAFKPNVAFYECLGTAGWHQFELTIRYIREHYPDILIIADAKRGDIGNTAKKYADTFFRQFQCDAVTVAPYMGSDSIRPFLEYEGKWTVVLALTSNPGADDFQLLLTDHQERLFETVLRTTSPWGTPDNMMYVVGATRASMLVKVREIVPDHFLLIPGVGAQGGDLEEVAQYGMNSMCGLIVNSSRSILYADSTERFDEAAREAALETQLQMRELLGRKL